MKSNHRSISKTQLQPQSRTVNCYFDASAGGLFNISMISITDNLFTEDRKWFNLDSGSNDYDLWVLLISKKREEKMKLCLAKKKVIKKITQIMTMILILQNINSHVSILKYDALMMLIMNQSSNIPLSSLFDIMYTVSGDVSTPTLCTL